MLDTDVIDDLNLPDDASEALEGDQAEKPDDKAGEADSAEKQLEKYQAFRPFIDALEADPSKVYDIRAALSQGARNTDSNRPPAEAPPAPPSPERLRELNDRLKSAALDPDADFLGMVAGISSEIADAKVSQFRKDAEPYTKAVGEGYIERFKQTWKEDENPSIYKEASRVFSDELSRLDYSQLAQMSIQQREYELGLRRDAALGRILRSKVKRPSQSTANAGRGGGNVGGPGKEPVKVVELSDGEKDVLVRSLGEKYAAAAITRIEAGQ